jgi:hypothetical protein
MFLKRAAAVLALLFGSIGVVACMAGIYGAWWLGSRLDQANEKLFSTVDKGLASAEERIAVAQKRAKDSRITSSEIGDKLRIWRAREAKERLASLLEIDGQAEKLTSQLETVDLWMDTSAESIRGVQRALELARLAGADVEPESLNDVLEKVVSLRETLQQAAQTVDVIRDFATGKQSEADNNRLLRVTRVIARLLVTIGDIDTRLEEFVMRLSQLRTRAQQLNEKTTNYILLTTVGCYFILAWIGAGQAALCRCGWQNCS